MIKFFAWEGRWLKKVKDARDRELAVLIEDRIIGSCNEAVFSLVNASVIGESRFSDSQLRVDNG